MFNKVNHFIPVYVSRSSQHARVMLFRHRQTHAFIS